MAIPHHRQPGIALLVGEGIEIGALHEPSPLPPGSINFRRSLAYRIGTVGVSAACCLNRMGLPGPAYLRRPGNDNLKLEFLSILVRVSETNFDS
jgi:hypothetical protein